MRLLWLCGLVSVVAWGGEPSPCTQLCLKSPEWPPPALVFPTEMTRHEVQVRHALHIFPSDESNQLEARRELDRAVLFQRREWSGAALSGLGLFGFGVFATAHAPPPLRPLFDRRWHLGPAVLDGGGMGLGMGGPL